PRVRLFVPLELFLLVALEAACHGVELIALIELALHHEPVRIATDLLRVDRVEKALAERQVVDGIQQVGFSGAIRAGKRIHIRRKLQGGFGIILEIKDSELFQPHVGSYSADDLISSKSTNSPARFAPFFGLPCGGM